MKYKVTLVDNNEMKEIQRDLKHCRIPYIISKNFCDYTPGFDGFTITFSTKNKKVLEYMGFTEKTIKSFRDYQRPYSPRKYYRITKIKIVGDIEIPF